MNKWKDIKGYEGLYRISKDGEVYSRRKKGLIYGYTKPDSYTLVYLMKGNTRKTFFLHKLVAEHFIENPNHYECVIHKNGDILDNRADNLEWSPRLGPRKKVVNIDTSKVYNSVKEAGNILKIRPQNIISTCKHRRKTAGGYHWRYAK